MSRLCHVPGCDRIASTRGMCSAHYLRWIKYGECRPEIPLRRRAPYGLSVEQRLWFKVDRSGGPDACWPWQGRLNEDGYGRLYVSKQKHTGAHRKAYEVTYGPIPDNHEIDHLCHTTACQQNPCPHRSCCNPAHLQAITHHENVKRGNATIISRRNIVKANEWWKSLTQCKHGHLFTAQNTLRNTKGNRVCKTCQYQAEAAYRKRKRSLR